MREQPAHTMSGRKTEARKGCGLEDRSNEIQAQARKRSSKIEGINNNGTETTKQQKRLNRRGEASEKK